MKQITTFTNSFVLQELDGNRVINELGFRKGGLSYKIQNNNVKFYLVEDYFYKNVVWSTDAPLKIDGITYQLNDIPEALKSIFINEGGSDIVVDTELSEESMNPVANSTLTLKIEDIEDAIGNTYTKDETDEAIEDAIEHISLDDYYTKQETNAAITAATQPLESEIANKADLSALTTHTSDSSIHVTVADKNAWNAKLDAADVEGFFGAVGYDSQTKRINFYNETTGGTVLAYIDATAFIKDGMVNNVEIKEVSGETSLVISFNTDAGKEDIVIPISEIFDASNYYTKTEVDGALSSITSDVASLSGNVNTLSGSVESLHGAVSNVVGDVSTLSGQVQTNEATLTAHTANTTVHVTAQEKTTWNNKSDFSGDYNDLTNAPTNVSDFTNDAGYVTQTDIDESISGKADTSTVTALSAKVDTNEEVTSRALNTLNNALDEKQDTLIAGSGITISSGNVISAEVGVNVVQTTGSSSADVMSQSAVTNGLNDKYDQIRLAVVLDEHQQFDGRTDLYGYKGSTQNLIFEASSINGKQVLNNSYSTSNKFDLVETSAITTSVTTASTDSEIPSAKAVQTALSAKADTSAVTTVASDLTALSGEVATNEEVTSRALNTLNNALSGKQDTLSAGTNITIVDNVISAEGGGKAISAGTNISVTTGETADTVNCTLPITVVSRYVGKGLILGNGGNNVANGASCIVGGSYNSAGTQAHYSLVQGFGNNVKNEGEFASGKYNNSASGSSTFGDASNTLFSVGNGNNNDTGVHNALEIRQNGDIYIANTDETTHTYYYQKDMFRLQDLILALGGLKFVSLSQADYEALTVKDPSTLYIILETN